MTLKIFNVLGQEVTTLLNKDIPAGFHNVNFNAAGYNSGVYFYKLEAKAADGTEFSSIKKMMMLK